METGIEAGKKSDYEIKLKENPDGDITAGLITEKSTLHIHENCLIIINYYEEITHVIPLHNILYIKKK